MVEVPITTRKLPSLRAHTQWTGSDKQGSKRIEQVNPTHVDMLALTLLSYNSSVWIKTEAYGKESDKFANHQNEMKTRQNHMQESVVHHELVVQQVLVQNIHWSPGPKDQKIMALRTLSANTWFRQQLWGVFSVHVVFQSSACFPRQKLRQHLHIFLRTLRRSRL